MKRHQGNIFWGIIFVLAAVLILAGQVTSFAEIGPLSILAGVLLAAVFFQSLASLNFFGVFLSLALSYVVFQRPLDLPSISIWLLLLSAVLLSIGFSIIFPTRKRFLAGWGHSGNQPPGDDLDGEIVYARVSFGSASKYLHSQTFRRGEFSASFGSLNVFLDQAKPAPEGAEIDVFCSFGEIKLFVPKTWQIVDNITPNLGSVKNESGRSTQDGGAPKVALKGSVSFGSVEVVYV